MRIIFRPLLALLRLSIIIDYHWLSMIIIDYHWLSLIVIDYHWLSLNILDYHWLSLNIIDYHWLSLIIIDYNWLSLIIIDYSWLSMIIIDYQWLSLIIWKSMTDWLTRWPIAWNQEMLASLKKKKVSCNEVTLNKKIYLAPGVTSHTLYHRITALVEPSEGKHGWMKWQRWLENAYLMHLYLVYFFCFSSFVAT